MGKFQLNEIAIFVDIKDPALSLWVREGLKGILQPFGFEGAV